MFKRFKKRDIMLCPHCKQPTLTQATNISGWLDSSLYKCSDPTCGYIGRLYITIDPKQFEKKPLSDADTEDDDADVDEHG